MPSKTFDDKAEAYLLEIWSNLLISTDKEMKTRATKEMVALERLNARTKADGSAKVFTPTEVNNKIDTMRKKGRDGYKIHRLPTATGTSLDASNIDVQAAIASWQSFEVYHRLFFKHPQWGPGECIGSLDVGPAAEERPPVPAPVMIHDMTGDIDVQLTPRKRAHSDLYYPDLDVELFTPDAQRSRSDMNRETDKVSDPQTPLTQDQGDIPVVRAGCAVSKSKSSPQELSRKQSRVGRRSGPPAAEILEGIAKVQAEMQTAQFEHDEKMQQRWMDHEEKQDQIGRSGKKSWKKGGGRQMKE